MLAIKHKAPHLSKMKAYAEYCWSVDAYGSYQPASFIYLSFDSFSQLCQKHGVKLYEADECPDIYYGLITRIESLETADEIQSALLDGKNVIALYPNEIIGLYYGRSKELVQKAIEGAEKLGVSNPEIKITGDPVSDLSKILWEEIQTGYPGRLFATTDSFLSDGFFMPKYGLSERNSQSLISLVKEFSVFKKPVIRVDFRNHVFSWPCHEPISFIVELTNHSQFIEYANIRLSIDENFEPISPLEREIENFKTLSNISFAFQVIPRKDGSYNQPINISVELDSGYATVSYPSWDLEILPSFGNATRSHSKKDDGSLSKLIKTFQNTDLYDEIQSLPSLMSIDVNACLNRIRSVAEKLAYLTLERQKIDLASKNFSNAIQLLQAQKILSSRSIGYLNTIRIIGNLASHPSGETLTESDVKIVSYALACVMDEIIEKQVL